MTNKGSNLSEANLKLLPTVQKYKIGGGVRPEDPNAIIHWGTSDTLEGALDRMWHISNEGRLIVMGMVIFNPEGVCISDLEDADSRKELEDWKKGSKNKGSKESI